MYSPGHFVRYPIQRSLQVRVGRKTLTPAWMKQKKGSKKKGRAVRGKGAYYPGGRVLRGQGGFFDDVGNFFKKAAGPVLGAIGGVANTIVPGSGAIADGIRGLIGAGAYTPVRSNAILAQPVPKVGSSTDVGISYSHEEYLGDVTGSTDWELTQFHVNPGLPEVFPWLNGVASNFQKYRIDGLVFYLKSTSSVAIASSTDLGLGTVMGGFQYNVYDKAPGSKLEFLSLSGARSGKPSDDHLFPMECDRSKNVFGNLLVRTVGVVDDLAKYDHAVFNLATVGFPGEYYLGELWVSYRLTLMAPKVESATPTMATLAGAPLIPVFNIGAYNATPQPAVNPGSWNYTPPLSDHAKMYNSTGWTVGTGNDSYPCMLVPAGTSGYFLFEIILCGQRVGGNTNPVSAFFEVIDNTGTITADTTKVQLFGQNQPATSVLPAMYNSRVVYKIEAFPDRPLKLRLRGSFSAGDSVATPYLANLNCVRLPDKMFASDATGLTVSLAQKVQRMRSRKTATYALPATSRLESYTEVKEEKSERLNPVEAEEQYTLRGSQALPAVPRLDLTSSTPNRSLVDGSKMGLRGIKQ